MKRDMVKLSLISELRPGEAGSSNGYRMSEPLWSQCVVVRISPLIQ